MVLKSIKDINSILYNDVVKRNKLTPFLIFISLLISFGVVRFFATISPVSYSILIKSYHIHHFFLGIFFVIVSSWIALVSNRERMFKLAAVLLGVGSGLIIDELGLLLTCTSPVLDCNYYSRQSYDALIIISTILLSILYSGPIWSKFKSVIRLHNKD